MAWQEILKSLFSSDQWFIPRYHGEMGLRESSVKLQSLLKRSQRESSKSFTFINPQLLRYMPSCDVLSILCRAVP